MSWRLTVEPSTPFGRLAPRVQETGQPGLRPLSVYIGLGVVPRDERDDNHNRLGEDMSKYLVVRPGDVVFNKLRTWQGGLGVSAHHGLVSPAYFVCRPTSGVHPRYLGYLLTSAPYLAELTRISKWMPPSQFDIGWPDLKRLPVGLPSRTDQAAIADFLDAETARIDHLLAQKRRLIALLQERIDSELMTVVGASRLVDVDGEVGAEPVRRLLRKVDRPGNGGQMVTAFRDGQVTARALRRADGYTESWTEIARVQGVAADDVVVHGLDGFAGAIGTAEVDGVCSPVYHVCVPSDGGDAHFYGRLLRLLATTGYLGLFASSTRERAVDFRNWDLFGRIPIPRVGLADQRRIGASIRRLAPLRVAVARSAELVQERKQALITAAVTGQLDLAREIAEEAS